MHKELVVIFTSNASRLAVLGQRNGITLAFDPVQHLTKVWTPLEEIVLDITIFEMFDDRRDLPVSRPDPAKSISADPIAYRTISSSLASTVHVCPDMES